MPIITNENKVELILDLFRQLSPEEETKVINEILKRHTPTGLGDITIEL